MRKFYGESKCIRQSISKTFTAQTKGRLKTRISGFQTTFLCGGLLVFAQIISNIKNAEILERRGFRRFCVWKKVASAFNKKPRGNARFFVESCRVLIGF